MHRGLMCWPGGVVLDGDCAAADNIRFFNGQTVPFGVRYSVGGWFKNNTYDCFVSSPWIVFPLVAINVIHILGLAFLYQSLTAKCGLGLPDEER